MDRFCREAGRRLDRGEEAETAEYSSQSSSRSRSQGSGGEEDESWRRNRPRAERHQKGRREED